MLASALALALAASTPTPIDAAELTRRGELTAEKFVEGGARWLVRQKLGQAVDLGLRVTRFGSAAQYDFLTIKGDTETPFFSISQREGVWATTFAPGKPPLVTRPYEVTLPNMSAYLLLAKSELGVFRFTGVEVMTRDLGATSTWVSTTAPGMDDALRAQVTKLQALSARVDGGADDVVEQFQKKLAEVPVVEVENATGVVLHAGQAERGLFFSEVEVLTKKPAALAAALPEVPARFELDGQSFAIAWDPLWRPGGAVRDTDMVLFHLEKPGQRRVPNRFGLTGQLAFLTRSQAVVISTMPSGGFRPVWIDLVTGENRLLGDAWGALPVVLFPVVSPDSKQVAVLAQGDEPLFTQLQVIDVATGAVRNVGAQADQAFVNWLPGDGFVLVRRVLRRGEKEPLSRIVRLTKDGKETELVSNATRPVVLAGNELLFKDLGTGNWNISDLSGKKRRLLGDGLPALHSPTVSPDGNVLMMMENTPAPEPRLVIQSTAEVLPLPLGKGLWANPQWR